VNIRALLTPAANLQDKLVIQTTRSWISKYFERRNDERCVSFQQLLY